MARLLWLNGKFNEVFGLDSPRLMAKYCIIIVYLTCNSWIKIKTSDDIHVVQKFFADEEPMLWN